MQIPEIRIEPGLLPVIYLSDLKGEFILTAKTGTIIDLLNCLPK
jgi:hypothetical protein